MVGKQLQSINFIPFLKNPIFHRKFPLIKLQICRIIGQAKSSSSSNFHSMALYFCAFPSFRALSIPRSKSAVNVVRTRSLKKSSANQRFLRPVCTDGTRECDVNGAVCNNIPGSYNCTCKDGFVGDGITNTGKLYNI